MEQYEHIFQKYPNAAHFIGTVLEEDLLAAEKELGLKFPMDYRTFVKKFGAGYFHTLEIYGIIAGKQIECIPNAVWVTRALREKYCLPESYIAIGFDGISGYYCIHAGMGNVVLFETRTNAQKQLANSFLDFLLKSLKLEINDFKELF